MTLTKPSFIPSSQRAMLGQVFGWESVLHCREGGGTKGRSPDSKLSPKDIIYVIYIT